MKRRKSKSNRYLNRPKVKNSKKSKDENSIFGNLFRTSGSYFSRTSVPYTADMRIMKMIGRPVYIGDPRILGIDAEQIVPIQDERMKLHRYYKRRKQPSESQRIIGSYIPFENK